MPDTIIVALITFCSAFFGAGLSALITWKTTKLSIDNEWKNRLRDEKKLCYSQFITAYHALTNQIQINTVSEQLIPELLDREAEIDLHNQFQAAYSSAILICAKSSVEKLTALYDQAFLALRNRDLSRMNLTYKYAVDAIRKELDALEKQPDQFPNRRASKPLKDQQQEKV